MFLLFYVTNLKCEDLRSVLQILCVQKSHYLPSILTYTDLQYLLIPTFNTYLYLPSIPTYTDLQYLPLPAINTYQYLPSTPIHTYLQYLPIPTFNQTQCEGKVILQRCFEFYNKCSGQGVLTAISERRKYTRIEKSIRDASCLIIFMNHQLIN